MTNPPGGRGVTGLPVRRLIAADLPQCSALAVDRDWEPTPDRWRLLYELGEMYGVDDPDGGLAGAVALIRYGPGLASIGKMLVARRHGRQGLGGRLMRHAMDQAGDTVICLLATEYGRPLYERLGFRAIDRSVRYIGSLTASQPDPAKAGQAAPREVSAADLPGIAELDRRSFGADRGALLTALPRLADQFVVSDLVVSDGPAVRGFGAAWRSADTLTIGPVVGRRAGRGHHADRQPGRRVGPAGPDRGAGPAPRPGQLGGGPRAHGARRGHVHGPRRRPAGGARARLPPGQHGPVLTGARLVSGGSYSGEMSKSQPGGPDRARREQSCGR